MPFTQLTDDLWVLNRPARLGPIDLGHRMTVVRLASGRLWVHSPVALDDEIRTELDALGEVENFVAPSTFHDLYWPAWFAAYPEARFYAAPGVRDEHPELPFTDTLGPQAPSAWADQLGQTLLGGLPKINEVVFVDHQSKTLIAADLVFNYDRTVNLATSLLLRMTGTYNRCAVSRLFKFYIRDKKALRHSIDQILS